MKKKKEKPMTVLEALTKAIPHIEYSLLYSNDYKNEDEFKNSRFIGFHKAGKAIKTAVGFAHKSNPNLPWPGRWQFVWQKRL